MRKQVYNIDRDNGAIGQAFLADAINKFVPGTVSQMSETFDSAMDYNTAKYVYELVKGLSDDSPVIQKELWNKENHENFRNGIPYREGLTEDQAYIEAERYDREMIKSQYMRNTDPFDLHNLGAAFSAAIFDPLSYVPMVGLGSKALGISARVATRMGRVANVATKIHPVKSLAIKALQPLKPMGLYAAEGALAESTFQIIRASAEASNGRDFDYMGAMLDVSIATVFGTGLGTFPTAMILKKNFTDKQIGIGIAKTDDDFRIHGESQVDGPSPLGETPLTKEQAEFKHNADMSDLKNNQESTLTKDLHPILDRANQVGEEGVMFVKKTIDKFRKCPKNG